MPRRTKADGIAIRALAKKHSINPNTKSGKPRPLNFLIKKLTAAGVTLPKRSAAPKASGPSFINMIVSAKERRIALYTESGFRTRKTISNMIAKTPVVKRRVRKRVKRRTRKVRVRKVKKQIEQPTAALVAQARDLGINKNTEGGSPRSVEVLDRMIKNQVSILRGLMRRERHTLSSAEKKEAMRATIYFRKYEQ